MAVTGLSIPVFGKYTNTNGTVTYSEGKTIGHAISYSVDLTTGEDNNLYGDNMIVESDNGTFQSGTLTLTTSELTPDVSKWLLGLTEKTFTVDSDSVTEYVYDDSIQPINLGFGVIEQSIINGVTGYQAIVLPKVVSQIPNNSANTRGETIEWQTKEITFSVMRDDTASHQWKIESEIFTTEAAAIAYLEAKLGVS